MEQRRFGNLGDVISLPLGGGALARSGAPTSREEAVATVTTAADWGIKQRRPIGTERLKMALGELSEVDYRTVC